EARSPRERARGAARAGARARAVSGAPGAGWLALLAVPQRGRRAARGRDALRGGAQPLRAALPRDARPRGLPAPVRLRGLFPFSGAHPRRSRAVRGRTRRVTRGRGMRAVRVFQLTTLALVLVAVVQVGWWLFDTRANTIETVSAQRGSYAEQVGAAQA